MTNYSLALIAVVLFLFASSSQSPTSYSTSRQTPNTAPSKTSKPSILFDDFSYTNKDQLKKHGWILRKAPGWPGVPGANWSEDGVSIVLDPDRPGNRILRMTSSTDGTGAKTNRLRSVINANILKARMPLGFASTTFLFQVRAAIRSSRAFTLSAP